MKYFKLTYIFFSFIAIFAVNAADVETEKLLWQNTLKNLEGIKASGSETEISIADKTPDGNGSSLKMHFKVNHENGKNWPQVQIKTTELDADLTTVVEFMFYYTPIKGKIKMLLDSKPVHACKGALIPSNLRPDAWHKIRLPLTPSLGKNVKINAIAFCVGEKYNEDKSEAVFYISDLKIISTGKVINPLQTIITPVSVLEPDKRQDIEVNNLLVNAYFKEGGNVIPPRGWTFFSNARDNISYAKGIHDGRAIKLEGSENKTVVLMQQGIQLVPGEKYKVTGYLRGDDFKGMGGIGVAGDAWHKSYVLKLKKSNVKKDWHFFELPFVFDPKKTNDCKFVIYLKKGAKGSVYVDRPILEPLTKRGLKESKNRFANDHFDENYAKAKKEGKLKTGPPSDDYKLVWSDEFDGPEVDKNKWVVLKQDIYKESRGKVASPERARLDGKGCLELTNKAEGGIIYAPFLHTKGKFATTYGYFECRFKIHKEDGLNAAFWMMPEGRMTLEGPEKTGMEIDIFECVLPSMEKISHTTHWYVWSPEEKKNIVMKSGGTIARTVPGLKEGFHTIGFEWTPDEYVFYIDGVESYRLPKEDHPITKAKEHIILTYEMSKAFQNKVKNTEYLSSPYIVDYVRVYKKRKQ